MAEEAHTQNRVVLTAAAEATAAFAMGGYFTVAEGILYPFMLDLFVMALQPHGIEPHYAVLRAPIGVVQQRVQDRTTNRRTPVRWRTRRRRRPVGAIRAPRCRGASPGRLG